MPTLKFGVERKAGLPGGRQAHLAAGKSNAYSIISVSKVAKAVAE
jgi:hypothetical protein